MDYTLHHSNGLIEWTTEIISRECILLEEIFSYDSSDFKA